MKVICTLFLSVGALAASVLAADANCVLQVPKDPLTAKGLAKPYILKKGTCDQTNADQQVFVEAVVYDIDTKSFSVYHPLVINEGTKPAIPPVLPELPKNAVVGIWFGANSNSVTLTGDIHSCTNGLSSKDVFGQFAYCNGAQFFKAVHQHGFQAPALGSDTLYQPCPTTRHFGIIDQDQSDNVITTYLQARNKRFAQNTAANRKRLGHKAAVLANGSDNALMAEFVDPILGCQPFKARSLMERRNVLLGALALNELHAAAFQKPPVALVPAGDPMVLSNGETLSLAKTNAYRRGVDQPLISNLNRATTRQYCIDYDKVAPNYIQARRHLLAKGKTPDPAAGNNLLNFMGQRYFNSWAQLQCDKILKRTSAITVKTNKEGVAIETFFGQSKPIKK